MRRGPRPHSAVVFLSIDGVVGCAISRRRQGEGLNQAAFVADFEAHAAPFIRPFPGPCSVVLLDNSIVHYAPELEAIVTARGGILVKLYAYGYEDMPVEKVSPKLVRTFGDPYLQANLRLAIRRAVNSVTPADAASYFECSGVQLVEILPGVYE